MRDPGGPHMTVLGGSKPHQSFVAVECGETQGCHPLRWPRSLIIAASLLAAIQSSEFLTLPLEIPLISVKSHNF